MGSPTPAPAPLLKALRQATTAAAATSAINHAVEFIISTKSLAVTQQLTFGLQSCASLHRSVLPADCVVVQLQQAAAICAAPTGKAEFLGFILLQQLFRSLEYSVDVSSERQLLLKVYNANRDVLPGFVAALTSGDGPLAHAEQALQVVAPVLKAALISETEQAERKAMVLDTLSRVAWHVDSSEAVRTAVAHILVQALELVPRSDWRSATYAMLVALAVDLLASFSIRDLEHVVLAAQIARLVLETTQWLLQQDVGVLALLQSLERLAAALPEALWRSEFLTSCGYFLAAKCSSPMEQQLMLRVLTHTLTFGREATRTKAASGRSVYVETLVLPLSSILSSHGSTVSKLLKLVTEIQTTARFTPLLQLEDVAATTETAAHAQSIVRLIGQEKTCEAWLASLFPAASDSTAATVTADDKWLALLIVALLSDDRPSLRDAAAGCLERQASNSPKFWSAGTTKMLVTSLVFLVSQQPAEEPTKSVETQRRFAEWVASCLFSLATLAATTTDTMRIVLRLIDSMNSVTKMRAMALKLLFEVWRKESRVFPRLETMLLERNADDQDVDRHVVKVATIKALCETEPEQGVEFISSIQSFLEDELGTVVAMAMDAIAALCAADCLDFYVAFKIIALKMRKNKVTCTDAPLFQERLCCFYALGGAESAANGKHATKLLDQAWGFADSEIPSVRKAAYFALSKFPLEMLTLCVPSTDNDGADSNDEQVTEEEVAEQLDELLQRLQNEQDADVRVEIEKLVARVLDHESRKLTAGVGRGQRMASTAAASAEKRQQQSPQLAGSMAIVSAVATKELRKLLPSRDEVLATYLPTSGLTADWSGFLLAYRPKGELEAQSGKRKDKLVRLATQNVDELEHMITTILPLMELPWEATASPAADSYASCGVFLQIQSLMEGWKGFMATYVASLEELAALKTPMGVDDADVAFRVFSEAAAGLMNSLLDDSSNRLGGALAAGALAGELCESRHWEHPQLQLKYEETVTELSRRLALAIEEARVFSEGDSNTRSATISALLALQLALGHRQVGANESSFVRQLQNIEQLLSKLLVDSSDELIRACALLGLSHIGMLYMSGDELEASEKLHWRQQRVQPIAELILASFLHADAPKRPAAATGGGVFSLSDSREAKASTASFAAEFAPPRSSGALVLLWASSMGLARLSFGFPAIKRLDWLSNLQALLSVLLETGGPANIVAVALGPVLLTSVEFSLCPTSVLETFVATCVDRAAVSEAEELSDGFLLLAVPPVLCRLESHGGFPGTFQTQTKRLVNQIQKTLADDSTRSHITRMLALAGVANVFHLSLGIAGSFFAATRQSAELGVELSLDTDTVSALVEAVRTVYTTNEAQRGLASAVLGAIARRADSFYVSQKKKAFDVEIRSFPSTTLLFKTLEWLREATPSSDEAATSMVSSLLACLSEVGAVLPLLDYASLIHRVMLRFCSLPVQIACIRFAATQGSCDALVATEWLSCRRFGNANAAVQAELLSGLPLAAPRLPTDTLRALLLTVFGELVDRWRRDTSSMSSGLLFDSWTCLLAALLALKPNGNESESSLAMVNQLVVGQFALELPFGPDATPLVQQYAAHVLTKADYGDCGAAETLLTASPLPSPWTWWQNGVFLVELARVKALNISKREASLAFQWVLRHDFDEWTEDSLVVAHLEPLIAQVGALVAHHTRPEEIVAPLLDAVDAFSRSLTSSDRLAASESSKRRALFDLVACVCSCKLWLSHEQFLVTIRCSSAAEGEGLSGRVASELLPFGLRDGVSGARSLSAVSARLWELQQQLMREVEATEHALEYRAALQACSCQMYVAVDTERLPSAMRAALRELWSLR